jgi:tetratricopeptide (TPR) repeat protein
MAFGVLTNTTSSLLGKWSDLAIFSGLYALISVIALEFFKPSMIIKGLLYLFLVLSLIFMVIVNSLMSWLVLGILSLVLLIFLISSNGSSQRNWTVAKLPIVLILISIVFILARGPVGDLVSGRLGITQLEARPSLRSTWDIAKNTLPDNPGFGAGPNRFSSEWGMFKSEEVNNTIFWNIDFNFGVGVIPTNLVTTGILGFLSWIVFLGSLLFLGARALFTNLGSSVSRFLVTSSFLATLFLWTFSVIYVPGVVVLSLTFLMTGAYFATMSKEGLMRERGISFGENSKVGFVSVFFLIILLIINIAFGYLIVTRYLSATYFQKTLVAANIDGDINKAGGNMNRAILFAKTDRNYRLLSQLHIANLNDLLSQENLAETEEGRAQFQGILGSAIASAQEATRLDGANYQNWLALGNIYEAIVPIGIEGSYESSKLTYERAQKENPTNPSVDLVLARLEVANGDNERARELIANALIKKNDYTEAIFLLSQIEINEGNIDEAISSVETASLITPNDPIVFFQLGFLKYNERDFDGAIRALERAVGLNPPYSNAKYFLGLSYYNVGRNDEAIQQFEDIDFLNPDNSEVKAVLDNLKAGKAPLPETEAPEDRESLPVEN